MNRIVIYCPYCGGYERTQYVRGMFMLSVCSQWLCDENGTWVKGFEMLAQVLKSGKWYVNGKTRKPGDGDTPPAPPPKVFIDDVPIRKYSKFRPSTRWSDLMKIPDLDYGAGSD